MILSLREREFTQTAMLSGSNTMRLVLNEYMPLTMPLIFSTLINNMAWAIGLEMTLAILGLIECSMPTLGTMLDWAISYQAMLLGRWWWVVTPDHPVGFAIYSPVLAFGQHQRIPGSANTHPAGRSVVRQP